MFLDVKGFKQSSYGKIYYLKQQGVLKYKTSLTTIKQKAIQGCIHF